MKCPIYVAKKIELLALQEVNEMWAGLGYYRRARFLLEVNKRFLLEVNTLSLNILSNVLFLVGSKDGCCREGGLS